MRSLDLSFAAAGLLLCEISEKSLNGIFYFIASRRHNYKMTAAANFIAKCGGDCVSLLLVIVYNINFKCTRIITILNIMAIWFIVGEVCGY